MTKQVHLYYSGNVQGVGFRFTAVGIASRSGIVGWVKNLKDGRVEILAEGEKNALDNFLKQIYAEFAHYIRDVDAEWLAATAEFKDFAVRF